ncbi:uncharacterized protein LOC114882540 [Osmia bicornis bicornis]|uniref:uncharacterized protein LOC114882540 n=1 Tax=Osmia bicornis bicornis TaxID=1437191 RepID=UPI0010F5E3AD|nr:uncharacterized protein LOC114882540 [Osmia bicornis bicornis]
MVQPLTIKSPADSSNFSELVEMKENEKIQNRQKSRRKSVVVHSISLIVLHVLDTLLLIVLLPFMIWQWVSASSRFKLVLKAVIEVTLELLMWVIFAGVSILMTTAFVLDDAYFRNNDQEKLTQLIKTQNVSTSSQDNGARILET